MTIKTFAVVLFAVSTLGLSACSAERVVDRSVDSSLWAGKTVVKTGVGATKLVARGTAATVRAVVPGE